MESNDHDLKLVLGRIGDALLKVHFTLKNVQSLMDSNHEKLMSQAIATNSILARVADKIDEARRDIDDAAGDVEKLRDDLTPVRGIPIQAPQDVSVSVGPIRINEGTMKRLAPIAGAVIAGAAMALIIGALFAAYIMSKR